jgi:hypothetical protein
MPIKEGAVKIKDGVSKFDSLFWDVGLNSKTFASQSCLEG